MCWAFDNTLLSSIQDGGILLYYYYTFDIFAFKKKTNLSELGLLYGAYKCFIFKLYVLIKIIYE